MSHHVLYIKPEEGYCFIAIGYVMQSHCIVIFTTPITKNKKGGEAFIYC